MWRTWGCTCSCGGRRLVKDRLVLKDGSGGAEGDEEDLDVAEGCVVQGVDLLGEVGVEGAVEGEGEAIAVAEAVAFREG